MIPIPETILTQPLAMLPTAIPAFIQRFANLRARCEAMPENLSIGDFVNQRRAAGESRLDAILESGRIRLRPIIMTTVAMIFGMMPLAFAIGEGAEQRAPMARAVIGGLITSTPLTLFVVPAMYTILDDAAEMLRARSRARAVRRQVSATPDAGTPA